MEMEWRDHFQTRAQTWRLLEVEALLAVAVVGLDWRLDNILATCALASLLIVLAFFGALLTLHHRRVEVGKIAHVYAAEEHLGLLRFVPEVKLMKHISWKDAFSLKSRAVLYVFRIHVLLIVFGLIYLVFRLST